MSQWNKKDVDGCVNGVEFHGPHHEDGCLEDIGSKLTDMLLRPINVGDTVARATTYGRSAFIEIRKVTRIDGGKIYLGESKVAIKYPSRLLVITSLRQKG